MLRTESRPHLDAAMLADVEELVATATRSDGYRPLGEHKYAQLRGGTGSWTGLLAFKHQQLVGYGHLRWNAPGARPRATVETIVHPDYRHTDCVRQLLDVATHVVARAGGGVLYLWVHRVEEPEATVARAMGFTVQRNLAFMTRRLTARPHVPPLPPRISLRAYRGRSDDAAFLRVNNEAFAGHPEQGGWDAGELADRRRRAWFEAAGLLLAWRALEGGGEELAGFHWTKYHGPASEEVAANEPVGEVYVLGVHPGAQGHGLGRALLEAGLAYLYDRGCRLVVLYVDRVDVAAVATYEASGFKVDYSEICYETVIEPAAAAAS